nr:putative reverse transcriptase domain-containing protein [Tanacetum cinerariifolium]
MLKVSPWKGVVRFGKRGKLNPRYIGPFKVLVKVGTVAYRLEFLEQLSRVHSTFHVSNLKKCLSDEPLAISLDEVHFDHKLRFVEEPVEVMDHEVKRLKQSCIPIIKVQWNSRRGPEFTWEREDQFRKNNQNYGCDGVDVPLIVFAEDGLSAIATKFGTPLMLDAYTTTVYGVMGKSMLKVLSATRVVNTTITTSNSFDALGSMRDVKDYKVMGHFSTISEKEVNNLKERESKPDHVESDNETAQFMVSSYKRHDGGINDPSLCELDEYDLYDGYDDVVLYLMEEQIAFCNAFDINLQSQIRREV